ncbi:Uncharacterised protein [Pseudomonas luteola]|uniref:Lipoprotein n=1 Tax=Pseudomonas luteola TaxID=47886 RepID=A0A2X2CFU0_PSELU|nr:hypothetical protein [Pseudomonas luteola]SPZ07532.1 Uncharacterised protein [Pseudomonas luteola]
MPDSMARENSKTRRMWDAHGSWLLLLVIGVSCFMAGSAFNAASTSQTVQVLAESYERQDKLRVQRIRELNDLNVKLAQQVANQVHSAVEKADQAATKANEAAAKASEVVEKVQPIQ